MSKSQPKRKEKTLIVEGALPVPRDLLCAGIELDADIEIERQHRMEALKAELGAMAAQGNFGSPPVLWTGKMRQNGYERHVHRNQKSEAKEFHT